MEVTVGNVTLWFSYRTVVAFSTPETGLVVRENDWKGTTGKHLNWIDGGNKIAGPMDDKASSEAIQSSTVASAVLRWTSRRTNPSR